jgi:hypothetical protein
MYNIIKSETPWGQVSSLVRIEDNAFIPFDPANTDYQAYLKWLEEGNTPKPADNINQGGL